MHRLAKLRNRERYPRHAGRSLYPLENPIVENALGEGPGECAARGESSRGWLSGVSVPLELITVLGNLNFVGTID